MERLGSPYQKNKLTPIEMLLQRLKQSQLEQEKETVEEKVNRQYDMFVAGNREVMLRRLHNDKTSSQLNNISSKTQPIEEVNNKGLMKIKTDKEFLEEAEKEYNKNLKQRNKDCFNGAMSACAYVNNKKDTIDRIAKRLTEEHNKKAEDFNNKLKSQTKKNPLTTTADYLINPETDRVIKNPVVSNLEIQQKLKDKRERLEKSDAFILGKQDKERFEKDLKDVQGQKNQLFEQTPRGEQREEKYKKAMKKLNDKEEQIKAQMKRPPKFLQAFTEAGITDKEGHFTEQFIDDVEKKC